MSDTTSFIATECTFTLPDGTVCAGITVFNGEVSYSMGGQLTTVYRNGWFAPEYRFVTFADIPIDLVEFLNVQTFKLSDLESYFDEFDHNTKVYFLNTYYPGVVQGVDISSITINQLEAGNPGLYDDILDIGRAKALNNLTLQIIQDNNINLYNSIVDIGKQEALDGLSIETIREEKPQIYDAILNIGKEKALNNLTLQIIKDYNINLYNSIVDIGRNEALGDIDVNYIRDNYPDVYNAIANIGRDEISSSITVDYIRDNYSDVYNSIAGIGRDEALDNLTFAIVLEYAPDVFTQIRDFGMQAALQITPEELQELNPDLYNSVYDVGHVDGVSLGESNAFVDGFFGDFFGGVRDSLNSLVLYQSTDSPIPINVTVWGVLSTIIMLFIVIFVLKLIAGG